MSVNKIEINYSTDNNVPQMNPNIVSEIMMARFVYSHFSMFRDESEGPKFKMDEYYKSAFELIKPAWEKLISKYNIPQLGGVVSVESPWHATLLLMYLQQHYISNNQGLLFRGQFYSEWDIQSSFNRKNPNEKYEEEVKGRLFKDILGTLSINKLDPVPQSYTNEPKLEISIDTYDSAAQHYSIATKLIDWTTDPAVATFFAANSDLPRIGKTSSIYVLRLEEAIDLGFKVIIPPPFVERLYLQRGFFITHENEIDLKSKCFLEIQFPCNYLFQPFNLVRRRKGEVDLLKSSPSFQELYQITMDLFNSIDFDNLKPHEYHLILMQNCGKIKPYFMDYYLDIDKYWYDYTMAFQDTLFWTCYTESGENYYINRDCLKTIVDNNLQLVNSVIRFWRFNMNKGFLNWDNKQIQRANRIIKEIDNLKK